MFKRFGILLFVAVAAFMGTVEAIGALVPTAGLPTPENGAKDVSVATKLGWVPGGEARQQHVYFGTNELAVRTATDPDVPPGQAKVGRSVWGWDPGPLQMGTTYYWRIDSINTTKPDSPWIGELWSFTTKACEDPLDDFESYGNSSNLQNVWIFGGGAWTELSSTEHHNGNRSMEFQYYNKDMYKQSEVTIEFDQPEDWESRGVSVVGFFFRGKPGNRADQMYLTVEDAAMVKDTILYDGAPEDLAKDKWQGCGIMLEDLEGVDLTAVTSLTIGVGDPNNKTRSKAAGFLYIDDVALCVPTCIPELDVPGDLTGDCRVDLDDHAIMARDWGRHDGRIAPAVPNNSAGLKGHYKFDETTGFTARDYSGNNFRGTIEPLEAPYPEWEAGKINNSIYLQGNHGVMIADPNDPEGTPNPFSDVNDAVTITAWVKGYDQAGSNKAALFSGRQPFSANVRSILGVYIQNQGADVSFETGLGEPDKLSADGPEEWTEWNHYAFVKNTTKGYQRIYINGCLAAEAWGMRAPLAGIGNAWIGVERRNKYGYNGGYYGWIDDFRVYNSALRQREIVGIMSNTDQNLKCPLQSDVNIHDEEPEGEKAVNFKDYSILAENWLVEEKWPR